jgi:hypothetical protein
MSHLSHACYILCPSRIRYLDHHNNTVRRVQIMKLVFMQFSLSSGNFLPLRYDYPPQRPVLRHPRPLFLLCVRDKVSRPFKKEGKIIGLCVLILRFLDRTQKEKAFWTEWQQVLEGISCKKQASALLRGTSCVTLQISSQGRKTSEYGRHSQDY